MRPSHASVALALVATLSGGRVPPRAPSATPTVVRRVVELTLTAAPARLELRAGTPSDVFAYNGQVPGPTLELREGDSVVVHFRNQLPEPSTIHWHGLHLPFAHDGSPFHPVPPGGRHDYVFTIKPGAAGTYWYHPHPHHRTGHQVAKGLYGAIVVRAPDDPLPASLRERVLLLSDNRFTADGEIDFPAKGTPAARVDAENGREGDVLFVSGAVLPTFAIRSGEVQRWRVINASAARVYRLELEGHTLLRIGTDGGLFERPVEAREVLLGVGERAELLVRATGEPGTRALLRALPYDRYIPQTRPVDWNVPRTLAALQYGPEPPVTLASSVALPTVLRRVPALDTTRVTARRTMVLTQHLINGRSMDPRRVDVSARRGATEIWEVENLVGMDHPFHLHGFQFQVLSRNGVPEPFPAWKDVVNVPRHESVRFVVRYDDYAGKWMFHCHILDHEDHGMMGVLEVRP
ncbi:multicopper oxidase family protein [Roseisolibacter agri]|uniref:Copper-containing nitrite reductase n=1 Tax=Roseisolibacter agri TaxID=2014610 RepID=A0AA37Q247_9BACT|nr:multicopper oxidase family protein [Roseisolibacter agri]GLC25174.1 multicopper oxidase [Roseisolibacter agri]